MNFGRCNGVGSFCIKKIIRGGFMKRTILVILALLMVFNISGCVRKVENNEKINLYPAFEMNKRVRQWGFIDKSGQFVIEPKYDSVWDFSEDNIAQVFKNNGLGVINDKGVEIIQTIYREILELGNGYIAAFDGESYHIFNNKGEKQFFGKYVYVGKYKDGLFAVASYDENGNVLMEYVNKSGKSIIEPKYLRAYDFYNGKAVVMKEQNIYLIIDKSGKEIKELEYNQVSPSEEGIYLVKNMKNLYGYIDSEGNLLVEPKFVRAELFLEGGAIVGIKENDSTLFGVIGKDGNYIVEPKYANIISIGNNFYGVANKRDNIGYKYAVVNNKGEEITDFNYYDLSSLEGNLTSVFDGIKTYALDSQGKTNEKLPTLEGRGKMNFHGNILQVNLLNRLYYYNSKGELVWEENNDYALREGAQVLEQLHEGSNGQNIYYPVVQGLMNKEAQDEINKKLYDEFITQVEGSSDKYDYYNTSYKVRKINDLLTIEKNSEFYLEGDSNKKDFVEVFNISLRNGKFFELGDLFRDGVDYLGVLTNMVKEEMMNKMALGEDVYKVEEFTGIKENSNFIPQVDKIEILLNPSEIISQTQTFPRFSISQESLASILDMELEFWWTYTLSRGF